jgi:S1-C subfamily serine protease
MSGTRSPDSVRRSVRHRVLALVLALSALGCLDAFRDGDADAQSVEPRPVVTRNDLTPDERSTIELFRRASPSVVFITTRALRRQLFSLRPLEVEAGSGSGFVWDRQGHVVTNFHVIRGADSAQVTLADQSVWEADLVGVAPEKDLAVLKIEAPVESLPPIPVGTSADLVVGQKVLAIGNPFGFDQTLTTGVISAVGREINSLADIPIRDVIQTDAAINPGNSGGPLLDSSGRLIGVNTAIFSPSGAYAGIGFAIPVDVVNWVVPELIAHGRVVRPELGVDFVSDQWTARHGIEGALVLRPLPGSAAEEAGLEPTVRDRYGRILLGDVIVALDGDPVASSNDAILLLERRRPGEVVTVTVERDGERLALPIELGESRR